MDAAPQKGNLHTRRHEGRIMSCDGKYANADDYFAVWGCELSPDCETNINRSLKLAASQIHAAMAAVDACDCTLADWATDYLRHINCVAAALTLQGGCPCPNLSAEDLEIYGSWVNARLEEIRTGKIALCAGETGTDYPAFAVAEIASTQFAAKRILRNYWKRTRN